MNSLRYQLAHNWGWLALRGAIGIIFGLLCFFAPFSTLGALMLVFGVYLVIDGIAMTAAAVGGGARVGVSRGALLAEGLLTILAGLVTFFLPAAAALAILYLWAFWALVTGVLEIWAGIKLRHEAAREAFLIVGGILSVLLAVALVVMPAAGLLALTWMLGVYAVLFGAAMLSLAFRARAFLAETAGQPPATRAGGAQPRISEAEEKRIVR